MCCRARIRILLRRDEMVTRVQSIYRMHVAKRSVACMVVAWGTDEVL